MTAPKEDPSVGPTMGVRPQLQRPPTPSQAYVHFLRDWPPGARAELLQVSREATQTTVWLVTLSSGLLTFLAINRSILAGLTPQSVKWLLGLLMLTVLLGVLQRVVQLLFFRLQMPIELELDALMIAGTAHTDEPTAPNDMDDLEEIIAELSRFFDVDYSFMRTANYSMDTAREAYAVHFVNWKQHEKDRFLKVGGILAAFTGRSSQWGRKVAERDGLDLDQARRRARRAHWIGKVAVTLFAASCMTFLGAIAVLGFGLVAP